MTRLPLALAVAMGLTACGDDGSTPDAGGGDGGHGDASMGGDAAAADSGRAGDAGGDAGGGGGPIDWDAVLSGMGDLVLWDSETSELPRDNVTALAFDADGYLWIGSGGVSRFDGARWDHFTRETSDLPSDGVTAIAHGGDGAVWVDTGHPSAGGSLGRYEAATLTGTQFPGVHSSAPYAGPWFTDDGSTWGPGRLLDGVFQNATDEEYPWGGGAPASDFMGVEGGRFVWSWDHDGAASIAYRFDATTQTLEELRPDGMSSGATSGGVGGGMVYLATQTTIWAYDGTTWTELSVEGTGPEGNLGPQVHVSDEGIATWIAGGLIGNNFVVQCDGATVSVTDTGVELTPANPVVVGPGGNVWFGTGDGLAVWTAL